MAQLKLPEGGLHGLTGQVDVPGSKSISNRLLVLMHLSGATGATPVGLSDSADTRRMQTVLGQLAAAGPATITPINVGDAGTVMRFVLPLLCLSPGHYTMTGTERAHERPIGPLVDALRLLGARIQYLGVEGRLPLLVAGGVALGMPAGLDRLPVDAGTSSQFVSALLMVAPSLAGGLRLRMTGEAVSRPYRQMTLGLMRSWGARVEEPADGDINIGEGRYRAPLGIEVEPDWSSAAYWLAWAALVPASRLYIPRLSLESRQADACCAVAFSPLGVQAVAGDGGVWLRHRPRSPHSPHSPHSPQLPAPFTTENPRPEDPAPPPHEPLLFCGTDTPDLMPTAMILCALQNQPARFSGLDTLRDKESDRLAGMLTGLQRAGAQITEQGNGIYRLQRGIAAAGAGNGVFELPTAGDHRMAMAFSLLAARGYEVRPDRPEVVAKSYPGYWQQLQQLGLDWQP